MEPLDNIYCISLVLSEDVNTLLLEDLRDHIIKHFGNHVPQDQIEKALQHPAMAIRLVYGLYKGEISDVDEQDAIEKVKDLQPKTPEQERKVAGKSDVEKTHDTAKARAREISPVYWLWIMAVWKEEPDQHIDQSIFDYLKGENIKVEDILNKSYIDMERLSTRWHNEQYAQQDQGGRYILGPDSPGAVEIDGFWFIPVNEEDQELEGAKMQNCIGRQCKVTETNRIWSMRNKFNNPHTSIQLVAYKDRSGWYINQIKGKQNRKPIERYERPVIDFIKHLIETETDQIMIGSSSDFWYFDAVQIDASWLLRSDEPITIIRRCPAMVEQMDQETADDILTANAHSLGNNEDTALNLLLPKTSVEAVERLFKKSSKSIPQSFFACVLKHKKLTEESALALLNSGDLRRSAKLIIYAAYEPDRYLNELMKADVEDIGVAIINYIPSIEAFNGQDSFFAEIIPSLPNNYQTSTYRNIIFRKIPTKDLLKLAIDDVNTHGLTGAVNVFSDAYPILLGRDDIDNQTKIKLCKAAPQKMNPSALSAWLKTLSVDELKQLQGLNKTVEHLLDIYEERDAKWIGDSDETSPYYLVAERAETIEQLQSLMRQDIPRSNKDLQKHILRKIARLRRLEAMTT